MELWIGALILGLIYALMTIGIYITFRFLDFPDITVDGSFTTGAAISGVMISSGYNPFFAMFIAFFAGALAGMMTGLIHTKMKVNGLLAGILVMIGLYSINLHIMGRSNVPLLNFPSYMNFFEKFNPGMHSEIWLAVVFVILIAIFCILFGLFFKTDLGLTLRATGDNATMSSALGVNVDSMKIFGIALSNGLVGLSGAAIAQYQGFADIGMGIGMVVNGLAAVIIGEAILKMRSIYSKITSAVIGSIVFRFMIAFALFAGMNPIDLKLLTALFVLLTLYVSLSLNKKESKRKKAFALNLNYRAIAITGAASVIILMGYFFGSQIIDSLRSSAGINKKLKIGIVQVNSNGLLDVTRESFLKEMIKLGYKEGDNITIIQKNANGDMSTLNSIIDNFKLEKVNLIVTISTPATQVAINKVKDIPIVFATIANPFIIKAGSSDSVHLPNVTGIYGWTPMDKTMQTVTSLFPGKIKIGDIWDNGQANSEFNVSNLKKELKNYPNVEFNEVTVNSSADVHQAAASLVSKNIDLFLLTPDNTVYSAFDAVLKEADAKKIPVFIADVERLGDGALAAFGYDYSSCGEQAAGVVNRILKGEKPANIPFARYSKLTFGLNLDVAKKLGIKFSDDMLYKANKFIGLTKLEKKPKVAIVQFAMEPNVEICKNGIIHALKANGFEDGKNIEILYRNANADFAMINSIMQDLVARDVDIIVPLSTPVLQSAVQFANNRAKPVVVFTYVYDPYRVGTAKTPKDHLPNFTGVACFPPIEKMLDLIKEMYPDRNKVGVVWNSGEANSESVMIKVRKYASSINLEVVETTVSTPSEVLDASKSLVSKGANIFLNPGDNTLNVSYDSYAKVAGAHKIPLFSSDAELIYNGTVAVLGPDYYRTGFDGGLYISKVLNGINPKDIPIHQTSQILTYINLDVAAKQGFKISDSIIKRADVIIPDSSKLKNKKISMNNLNSKKAAIFLFNENIFLEMTYKGLMDEFNKSGILNDKNITCQLFNAQGDFNNTQLISKEIIQKKFDYIITLSTPALQAMSGANYKIPHIFGAVTDPYSLGVAKTPEDHRENITGVATFQPVESTIQLMRQLYSKAKRIGIVWNPAEASSTACTKKAKAACEKYGFELVEAHVSNTNEVLEAVNSVLEKKIDIFFTSGDNTVTLAVEKIALMMMNKKIPYFSNNYSDVNKGVFVSLGADYYNVGTETAKSAIRVFNGENPKNIPIHNFVPEKLNLNMDLAKKYHLVFNDEILKKYNQSKSI